MLSEISAAVSFITSHLYNKLPRRRVDLLAVELERSIKAKCQDHWYPDQPLRSAAYRCLRVTGEHADPAILQACQQSGMDIGEVFSCLPDQLTLWIDPGQVSHKVGDKGIVRVLYSDTTPIPPDSITDFDPNNTSQSLNTSPEVTMTPPDFTGNSTSLFQSSFNHSEPMTPDSGYWWAGSNNVPSNNSSLGNNAMGTMMDNLSTSYGHMTLSPAMAGGPLSWSASASASPTGCAPGNNGGFYSNSAAHPSQGSAPNQPINLTAYSNYLQKSTSTPNFTASSFAATKFGSTKLKSHGSNKQQRHGNNHNGGTNNYHQNNRLSSSDMPGFPPANHSLGFPQAFTNNSFLGHRPQVVSPAQGLSSNINSTSMTNGTIHNNPTNNSVPQRSMPVSPSVVGHQANNGNMFYNLSSSTSASIFNQKQPVNQGTGIYDIPMIVPPRESNPFGLLPELTNSAQNHVSDSLDSGMFSDKFKPGCGVATSVSFDGQFLDHNTISSDLLSEIGINNSNVDTLQETNTSKVDNLFSSSDVTDDINKQCDRLSDQDGLTNASYKQLLLAN